MASIGKVVRPRGGRMGFRRRSGMRWRLLREIGEPEMAR